MGNTATKDKDGDYRVRYRSWRLGNKEGASTRDEASAVSRNNEMLVSPSSSTLRSVHSNVDGRTTNRRRIAGGVDGTPMPSASRKIPLPQRPFAAGSRRPPIPPQSQPSQPLMIPTPQPPPEVSEEVPPPVRNSKSTSASTPASGVPADPAQPSKRQLDSPSKGAALPVNNYNWGADQASSRENKDGGVTASVPSPPDSSRRSDDSTGRSNAMSGIGAQLLPRDRGFSDLAAGKHHVSRRQSVPPSHVVLAPSSSLVDQPLPDSSPGASSAETFALDEGDVSTSGATTSGATAAAAAATAAVSATRVSPVAAPATAIATETDVAAMRFQGTPSAVSPSSAFEMALTSGRMAVKSNNGDTSITSNSHNNNNREQERAALAKIPKALSTGDLHHTTVFPKFQKRPARDTSSLKAAVIEQLCDAVAVEMVGPHYNTTPSGRILNHLYKPVYETVRKHIDRMPRKYALSASPVEVASDLRLLNEVTRNPRAVAVHVTPSTNEDGSVVTDEYVVVVAAHDRKSLLDTITRTLSSRASIKSADILTTNDGFVLDRFICERDLGGDSDDGSDDESGIVGIGGSDDDDDGEGYNDDFDARDGRGRGSGIALSAAEIRSEIEHYLSECQSPSPMFPMYARVPAGGAQAPTTASEQQQQQQHSSVDSGNAVQSVAISGTKADSGAASHTPVSPAATMRERLMQGMDDSNGIAQLRSHDIAAERELQSVNTDFDSNTVVISTNKDGGADSEGGDGDQERPAWEVAIEDIELVRVIGQGRSGKMYLANLHGQEVAAKRMEIKAANGNAPSNQPDHESLLGEFYREVTIVSKLKHPNVCQFIGVAIQEPVFITLFELLRGGSLAEMLRCNSRYSFFKVATDIARGMAYLHHSHVIHRDLKSDNILMDDAGQAKIADFGLSCFTGTSAELTAETGTYRWMAPEVIRHEPYSLPADVYSYGIVLWELLSRQQPYSGMTPVQAAFAVARQNMRPRLPSYVPKSVATLIKQCWTQNPRARPSFERILAALPTILESLTSSERKMLDSNA